MWSVALTMRSGRSQAQRGAVFEEALGVDFGELVDGLVRGRGVADDLVLHVGDVHHVVEREAARAQHAPQDVLKGEGPQIADVDVVVDGGSAGVHAHDVVMKRSEDLRLLREGVIEPQGHSESVLPW